MKSTLNRIAATGLLLAAAMLASAAQASPIVYTAVLNGASESPSNASTGTGTATVTFDDVLGTMRVQVDFSGLLGLVTASHIHCCTATPGTATAGVATVTPTFTGFPGGVTSGSYDHTFDMTAAVGSWNNAFIAANGGSQNSAFAALLAGAASGRAYLNIHTGPSEVSGGFPGGEIRGFLVAATVPEPAGLSLLALGLLGATVMRRRQHSA